VSLPRGPKLTPLPLSDHPLQVPKEELPDSSLARGAPHHHAENPGRSPATTVGGCQPRFDVADDNRAITRSVATAN
jgi:hypothetical protein